MRWKLLLGVIIVVGLFFLLFTNESGRSILGSFRSLLGRFVGAITGVITGKGENYGMILTVNKESFFTQKFEIKNSNFSAEGNCTLVKINGAELEPFSCSVSLENANGNFEYGEVLKGTFTTKKAIINDFSFKDLKIEIQVMPTEVYASGISRDKISIEIKNGTLDILSADGSIKCSINMKEESTEVNNYYGSFELSDNLAYLKGVATFKDPCTFK